MKKKLLISLGIALLLLIGLVGPGVAAAQPPQLVQVLIGFDRQPSPGEQDIVRGAGGNIKYTYGIIPVIAAAVPENAIAVLRANPRVTHVNLDGEVHAIAETLPWGVDRIDAELVWGGAEDATNVLEGANAGAGVKVAIIDTGIDKDHPDLAANIKGGVNFVSKPWWAAPDPNAWDDDNGHGSHVAGITAAVDNEEGVIGVAPEAHLYGVKVLDKTGSGYWSDVIAGIDWSVSNGMQVINMSLGASSAPDDLKGACDEAYAAGLVVVAAAGNSGDTDSDDDVGYPAKYESVIAVAATDDTDTRASWSSDGPAVELAAPGVSIPSAWKDGGYKTASGTSMASPHVAGTAALVIYAGVVTDDDGFYGIANEVRDRMNSTADDLGDPGRDTWHGWGLVDAEEAALGTPAEVHDVAVTTIVAPAKVVVGDMVTVDVTVKNEGTYDESFDVTLTDTTDSVLVGSTSVALAASGSTTVSFSWDTTGASIGDHVLKAEAILPTDEDTSDNSKSTMITVESAFTDIAITAVSAPSSVVQGDVIDVNVTVENTGNQDVTSDITVTLADDTASVTIGSQTISGGLAAGASKTLTFTWDTTGANLGDHTLTASHNFADDDSGNNSKTAVVTVSEAASTMHVGDLDGEGIKLQQGNWEAKVTITVHDADHNLVANAEVSGEFYQNGTFVTYANGTTDEFGTCTVYSGQLPSKGGKATFTVTGVSHATLTYDAAANHDPDGDSDGTSITVTK